MTEIQDVKHGARASFGVIDLEPTWEAILHGVISGHIKPEHAGLEKPCQMADIVRQAQKAGKKSVTFVFESPTKVTVKEE